MQGKQSYPIQNLTQNIYQRIKIASIKPGPTINPQYQPVNQGMKKSFIAPYCQNSKISPINKPKFIAQQITSSNICNSIGIEKPIRLPPDTSPLAFQKNNKKHEFCGQISPFQLHNNQNTKNLNNLSSNNHMDKKKKFSFQIPSYPASNNKIQKNLDAQRRDTSPISYSAIFQQKTRNQSSFLPKPDINKFLHHDNKNKMLHSMIIQQKKSRNQDKSINSYKYKHQVASTLSSQNNKDNLNENQTHKNKIKRPNMWPMTIQPQQKKSYDQQKLVLIKQNQCKKQEIKKKIAQFHTKNRLSAPLPKKQKKQFSIEDFQIAQKIGKGAYGDVFLAQQKKTSILCVIKTISKNKIKQQKLQQHIFRQIKLQAYMNHRHVTTLYGFFHDENKIYLIQEYLTDGNLSHVYRKKKVPQQKTSMLIKQVCDGISYMHRQSILHRDIKPQNLFIHQDYIKIGDFGCAIFSNTMRTTVVGCLDYISPEQLTNSNYDEKIDVWSLGILTYQLLTGTPPFQQDIIKIARHEKQPKLSQLIFPQNIKLSEQAKDFVKKLLRPNPEQRMDLRNALKHPFIAKHREHQYKKLN